MEGTTAMRGLMLSDGSLAYRTDLPEPEAGEGDVIGSPRRVLMHSFDFHVARQAFGFNGIPGRSFVAEGEGGQRFIGAGSTWDDDDDLVAAGFRTHSRNRTIPGWLGRDGALAERIALPRRNTQDVPVGVDDDHAIFAEPLAAALQTARQLTIRRQPFITVIGDGLLGLLMVQVLSTLNATVRLLGHDEQRLSLCAKWGIRHRLVADVGRRADQDIVVVCSASPEDFQSATAMIRPRGDLVLKVMPDSRPGQTPVDLSPLIVHELNVIGSWDGPVSEALGVLQRGDVDVVSLISRRCRLEEAEQLPSMLSQPGCVAVAVDV